METNLDQIKKVLDIDPLSEAEKITGKSYKEDKFTSDLGFGMHILHGERKRKLLESIDDTGFTNKVPDYLRKLSKIGFEVVLHETGIHSSQHNCDIEFYVLFNYQLGILLKFDTFYEDSVNGGDFYYNWVPGQRDVYGCTSSGSYWWPDKDGHIGLIDKDSKRYVIENYPKDAKWDLDKQTYQQFKTIQDPIEQEQRRLLDQAIERGYRTVYVGYHDCREAVITNITRMQQYGSFLPTWIQRPSCMWLTTFVDWEGEGKGGDLADEITRQRIAKLPEQVRKQIGAI